MNTEPTLSAQTPLMKLMDAALAWAHRALRHLGARRRRTKFDDRQLYAMLALHKCFGADNRWMTGIVADATALKDELGEPNWRELARRFIERG